MSDAPVESECRHCGVMNDSGASECWRCQRRDWRLPARPKRPSSGPVPTYVRIMVGLAIALIALVGLAFRVGRIIGLAVLILATLVYAAAIALFLICVAIANA